MRIVFFGTPPVAARILASLFETEHEIVAVISRPDKPKGRSKKLLPTPVKQYIEENHPEVPLYQPAKVSSDESVSLIRSYEPDLFVVVAYGAILKQTLLDVPKLLPINIHFSLLPKYRGAAPMQRSIMEGEKETGVTFMAMDAGMDTGDILQVEKIPLTQNQTLQELEDSLTDLSIKTFPLFLKNLEEGKVQRQKQNSNLATHAEKISKEDCKIDFTGSAQSIHNQIRGLSPFPGAYTFVEINGKQLRLKILRSRVSEQSGAPSQILSYTPEEWIVGCGMQSLQILEAQLEGKKTLKTRDFVRGTSSLIFL
ncbi:MAG: methionyl-tRNA formyltransferase [Candidatus Algichlamydia australiensis]|nr:methionyl-tRNA formyltransferase [Chlamydiales bacterium]